MRKFNVGGIIHIFALLHAVVALSCRLAGFEDELLLTILTMTMALIICLKKGLSIEFTAASIIVANVIGYFMGTVGADLLELVMKSSYAVHALSTAVTTEVLGWSIVAFTKVVRQKNALEDGKLAMPYLKWLLLAMGGIFILRLCIIFLFSDSPVPASDVVGAASKIFSNTMALVILVCINILYIRFGGGVLKDKGGIVKAVSLTVFILLATLLETVLVGLGLPFNINPDFGKDFPALAVTSLLTQITIYCLVYMTNYALTARSEMQAERGKANIAQYRYLKLKQQVNPHFLFNSLNILDCLVCEEKTEQASTYIHKLAGIYRYMIKSEEEELVQLRDELVFVNLYVDLLQVRFPEGFVVETDVAEEALARFVLPCSLQLLIENATKHNAVSVDNPLIIKIVSDGKNVSVSNNLVPKVGKVQSTGLGLKYIRQQYLDLSDKTIKVERDENKYCVTLPLL